MTSQQSSRSVFSRIWSGFWQFIDSARRITVNVLFLIILVLVIRFFTAEEQTSSVGSKTTLVIQPIGAVVEQYSGYPLDRVIGDITGDEIPETQLRDILEALDQARDDDRISQVLIDTSQLTYVGMANLQEIAQALETFRGSGKKVIAMGAFYTEDRYFLASLADEIWLDPKGMLWFDGFAYYRNYFKDVLDKLAVNVHLFRVGTYKSALEPFIRNDMSEADRTAGQFLIDDLWNSYLSAIALHRGLPVEVLNEFTQAYADRVVGAGGDTAQLALDMGLVDRLITWPDARTELAQGGSIDEETGFRQVAMLDYLADQRRLLPSHGDEVGVIVAEGTIAQGELPPGSVGATTLSKLLRQAGRDNDIKAVVLRVNSPGGDALASEMIRREMELLVESGKPVVISMGNVAASGGYWISMGAEEVWANPGTITGSIGIFGVISTFERTLDKIGIHNDGVGTTPLSGGLRPDRPLDDGVGAIIQSSIERGYSEFINLVATHRQMSAEEVDNVAQGRVWSGNQALERQLVDQSGTLQDAIAAAARRAGLGETYNVKYVEEDLSSLERWLVQATGHSLAALDIDMPQRTPLSSRLLSSDPVLQQLLRNDLARRTWQDLSILLNQPDQPQTLAHCFCLSP